MQVLGRKFWAVPGVTQRGVERVPQTRDTLSASGLMHIDLTPARDAVDKGHRGAFLWLLVSATQLDCNRSRDGEVDPARGRWLPFRWTLRAPLPRPHDVSAPR